MAAAGYRYRASGENLAAGSLPRYNTMEEPRSAAVELIRDLIVDFGMEGVGNRENILYPAFTEMGSGFARDTRGDLANYYVQDFGAPR